VTGHGDEATELSDAWIYRPRPVDGTTRRGWIRIAGIPQPLPGVGAFASGQAHVILVGRDVLAYHSVTDSWTSLGTAPAEVVSESAVSAGGRTYILGAGGVTTFTIRPLVKGLRALDYAVIVLYFAGMVMIGVYFSRRQTNSTEFALGGRRTKWWV